MPHRFLLLLSAALFVGCASDSATPEPPPDPGAQATCHIINRDLVMVPGASITVDVESRLPGEPSRPATATLALDAPTCATVNGLTLTAGAGACAAILTASVDATTECTAAIEVLGPRTTDVRVRVIDAETGLGIETAMVVIDTDRDGMDDGGAFTTNVDGISQSNNPVAGAFDLTVSARNYDIISILDVNPGDLIVPLRPRQSPAVTAGLDGTIDFVAYEEAFLGGNGQAVRMGFASAQLGLDNVMAFEETMLSGPTTNANCTATPGAPGCYDVFVPGLIMTTTAMPMGLVIGLNTNDIKRHFDVATRPDNTFAWGVAGELEVNEAQPLLGGVLGCVCDTDIMCQPTCVCDPVCGSPLTPFLESMTPFWHRTASAVQGSLQLIDTPEDDWLTRLAMDYDMRPDDPRYPRLDSAGTGSLVPDTGMTRFAEYNVPDLPDDPIHPRGFTGMLAMTGSIVPGQGFVPLGLATAYDCTIGDCLDFVGNASEFDRRVNGQTACLFDPDPMFNQCPPQVNDSVPDGHLGVASALPHSGLEGRPQISAIIALPFRSLRAKPYRSTGFFIPGAPPMGFSDQSMRTFADFPTMPASAIGRAFDFVAAGTLSAQRAVVHSAPDFSGVVTTWTVYAPDATRTFNAPAVMNVISDPFAARATGEVRLTGVEFVPGVDLPALAANDGTTIDDFAGGTAAFAVIDGDIPMM